MIVFKKTSDPGFSEKNTDGKKAPSHQLSRFWLRPPPVAQSEMLPFHPAQMDGLLPEDSAYLVQQLTNKGIIDAQGEVHPERIRQLKASEPLLAYRNQYYLEAELQYYALMSMRTTGESR